MEEHFQSAKAVASVDYLPGSYHFDQEKLCRHLWNCFERRKMSMIPYSTQAETSHRIDFADDVIVLADEKSKRLMVFCALCGKVYNDPYITSCGHTFCHGCVLGDTHAVCPSDNVKLSLLVRNLAVAEEVGELLVHCRYGCTPKQDVPGEHEVDPSGCPVTIKLCKRREHEEECEYAPVECPNSSLCRKLLRRDLKAHLDTCRYVKCPHYKFNCTFEGTCEELSEHLQNCRFEGVKGVLNQMHDQISRLQEELRRKEKMIEELRTSLAELSGKMEKIETTSSVSAHRIDHLEEQQADVRKEVSQTVSSIGIVMTELKLVQQQLGVVGSFEPQHLFKCQGTFVGHKGPVWALYKCGDLLFSASSDNTIKVWNLSATYAGPHTLTGHDGIVLALCGCAQSDKLFSGSSDNAIKVWSVKSFELLATIKAHDDPVCTLACNDSLLFSGSLRSIKVWDIQNYKMVRKLPSQNHWVRALVVVGKFLYSGSYQAVKIWKLDTLEVVHVLKCGGGSVYSLAVTDKHIICGVYENLINVWDVQTLQEMETLTGHVGIVYALAVLKTSGQTRLFSASYDKTIRVWNLELLTCAQTMARHEGSVTCLTVSRGRIFSGAVDSSIKVWQ